MTLAAGARLGPYEILAPIGAGGMGEVYRARDSRLKREVAVKVLPATFSADADRLRRFEQEAQTAGGLNHPNITAVHELGTHDDAPYIVTELLEGETLRARLSGGAIPVRKATDYAIQIASGLAAAHEKGIVHRDLKPENLFLTNDGRVKILDFGLAKLTQTEGQAQQHSNLPTAATEPGVVLGTLGYMSPEQVKGRPADARSDIFAFGAILYEMLSGSRAFHRETAAETMSAILREEPPELSATNRNVPPGLDRVVRHCLEKNPEERFHSAHDLAFDLRALSDASTPVLSSASGRVAAVPASRRGVLITAALGAAAAAAAFLIGRGTVRETPPSFRQMTFRRGAILSARFAPDGQTVVYSAAWEGKPQEIFVGRPESPESRPFGLSGAEVLAVSRSGDMAVSNNRASVGGFRRSGTLAQLSVAGGAAPRDIAEEVEWADWRRTEKRSRSCGRPAASSSSSTRWERCCIGPAAGSAMPGSLRTANSWRSSIIPSAATTADPWRRWIGPASSGSSPAHSPRRRASPGRRGARSTSRRRRSAAIAPCTRRPLREARGCGSESPAT